MRGAVPQLAVSAVERAWGGDMRVGTQDRIPALARALAAPCLVLVLGAIWPHSGLAQVTVAEDSSDTVVVDVLGAVARPGRLELKNAAAMADGVFAQLGGTRTGAYPFASLLLRVVDATPPRFHCVTPGARHAALLMGEDPALRVEAALIAGLLDGRIQRMSLLDRPFGRLGSDRSATMLRSGDTLAVPLRPQRVHVVFADGTVASVAHRAELMAGDYLDQLPADRLARRRDYVLHYPDGHVVRLALEAWNAEPTAVPPGSMLAPAAACLPVPD
jgi:hypothetical protein